MPEQTGDGAVRDLCNKVMDALARRDYDAAETYLAQGLDHDPNNIELLTANLTLRLQRKHWRRAGRAYAGMLKVNPDIEAVTWRRMLNEASASDLLIESRRAVVYGNCGLILAIFAIATSSAWKGWIGALTTLAALLGIIFLAELTYRYWLYSRWGIKGERCAFPTKVAAPIAFDAVSENARVYHAARGYDLVANTRLVRVCVRNGRVVEAHRCTTDANGNIGFTDVDADDGAVNVVVLGDSFTSFPGNGATVGELEGTEWPFFLKHHLARGGLNDVRIINFGRSGHGILQMADTAVSVLQKCKPDVVVFAFISHDFSRFRYWYHSRQVGGVLRGLRTQTPGVNVPLDECGDQDLIDERITWEWAQARLARGDCDDLLDNLIRRYEDLRRRTSLRAIDLLTCSRIYLCDYLFFGTPFFDVYLTPTMRVGIPRIIDAGYGNDTQFLDAIDQIKKSGAKILLLHLPLMQELAARQIASVSKNQTALMDDLTKRTGEKIYRLMPNISPDEVQTNYPRTPQDPHPSVWAQNLFGASLAYLILKGGLRDTFTKRVHTPNPEAAS